MWPFLWVPGVKGLKHKKLKLRPVARCSLSKDFEDVVAADLRSVGRILLFHMIDHATSLSAAAVVESNKNEV